MDRDQLIARIRTAFTDIQHPGDRFLLGSREGRDAAEAVAPFERYAAWDQVDAAILDEHYDALSFLSDGGFRFFLPAYLIADLNDHLETADPVFHLTGGFHDQAVEVPIGDRVFTRTIGRSAFVNPRRFGAMTFEDYARHRLSVFTRQECAAIVEYLQYRRSHPDSVDAAAIDAALEAFWLHRADTAPVAADLATHIADEQAFLDALEQGGS